MTELSDLEICKRIALIEGFDFTLANNSIQAKSFTVTDTFQCAHMGFTFNPLTDDALCFQLMLKHKIKTGVMSNGLCLSTFISYKHDARIVDESPNKSLCLAIIELNATK